MFSNPYTNGLIYFNILYLLNLVVIFCPGPSKAIFSPAIQLIKLLFPFPGFAKIHKYMPISILILFLFLLRCSNFLFFPKFEKLKYLQNMYLQNKY